MQLFLMFFLSQPVGMMVDMFGPRTVLIPTSILAVAGLIGLSFARQYWQIFLAQSLCFGLGAAGIFVPGLVAASQYFKTKRALAVGIVASGSSVGKYSLSDMARHWERVITLTLVSFRTQVVSFSPSFLPSSSTRLASVPL